LAARGARLPARPGEYVVNFRDGTPATAYVTDDLADAIEHGRALALSITAADAPKKREPPLGPTGPRSPRRAKIYRHNKKLAARRARARRK
jgi:hypothetical protein